MKGSNKIDKLFRDNLRQREATFKDEYWHKFKEDFLPPASSTASSQSSGVAGMIGGATAKIIIVALLSSVVAALLYFQFLNSPDSNFSSVQDSVRNEKPLFSDAIESKVESQLLIDQSKQKYDPALPLRERLSLKKSTSLSLDASEFNSSINYAPVGSAEPKKIPSAKEENGSTLFENEESTFIATRNKLKEDFSERKNSAVLISDNVASQGKHSIALTNKPIGAIETGKTEDPLWQTSIFEPIYPVFYSSETQNLLKLPFSKNRAVDDYLIRDKMFLGISAGLDLSFRSLVYSSNSSIQSATAERRKRDEKVLAVPAFSMEIGYLATPEIIISSGLNYYSYGSQARYSPDPLSYTEIESNTEYELTDNGGYLIYTDSIYSSSPSPQYIYTGYRWVENWDTAVIETLDTVEYSTSLPSRLHRNKVEYLEIPVSLSYMRKFRRIYLRGQLGLGLGILLRNRVSVIHPDFQAEQYIDISGEDHQNLLLNLNTMLEAGYRIHHSTYLTAGVHYKHALMESEATDQAIRNRFKNLGVKAGISFHF